MTSSGTPPSYAARIASSASGGEVIVSSLIHDLLVQTGEFAFGEPRVAELKGIQGTHRVYPVDGTAWTVHWPPSRPDRPRPASTSWLDVESHEPRTWRDARRRAWLVSPDAVFGRPSRLPTRLARVSGRFAESIHPGSPGGSTAGRCRTTAGRSGTLATRRRGPAAPSASGPRRALDHAVRALAASIAASRLAPSGPRRPGGLMQLPTADHRLLPPTIHRLRRRPADLPGGRSSQLVAPSTASSCVTDARLLPLLRDHEPDTVRVRGGFGQAPPAAWSSSPGFRAVHPTSEAGRAPSCQPDAPP